MSYVGEFIERLDCPKAEQAILDLLPERYKALWATQPRKARSTRIASVTCCSLLPREAAKRFILWCDKQVQDNK